LTFLMLLSTTTYRIACNDVARFRLLLLLLRCRVLFPTAPVVPILYPGIGERVGKSTLDFDTASNDRNTLQNKFRVP